MRHALVVGELMHDGTSAVAGTSGYYIDPIAPLG